MRFWQKIFFSSILIFISLFDIAAFILVSYSYSFSLQREKDNALRERAVILSSVETGISNADKIYPGASDSLERLAFVIIPLGDYHKKQKVNLALYNNGEKVYDNLDISKDFLNIENNEDVKIVNHKADEKRYLSVISKIPSYTHLTFIYTRDISALDAFRLDISRVFITVSAVLCAVLGAAVFILLKQLTRPLNRLNDMTKEIANGAYNKRVDIRRRDELGELGRTFNVMADSVEDKVLKLTKVAEDKQQFIDNLAHEMKTPLTSILGYSEFLQKAVSNEEQRITAAGHLHESAQRLQSLSTKLLNLTYVRSGEITFTDVDVEEIFVSLKNLILPSLEERNLTLETETHIKHIASDKVLLLSMLTNLVENAARASYKDGIITVKAYQNEYPVIEVSDNGCGIEEKEIEKITQPFYRVDKSRSRIFGGVGLGLSLVSQIAALHEAKLEIISQQNKGTSVKIIFYKSETI